MLITMFKKTILLILCLVVACQANILLHTPQTAKNKNESPEEQTVMDNNKSETVKCNGLNISSDVLNLCGPIRPMPKEVYFDYRQAVCVTLSDSVERLCSLNNVKLQLEESNPKVKNVTEFCIKMRSALNNSLYETKVPKQKEWIFALKSKLDDDVNDEKCKEACIQESVVVSPICSTFLQISALSEKYTSETSGGADTPVTNKKVVVADSPIQQVANNPHNGGTQTVLEGVRDDETIQVIGGLGGMQNQISAVQGSGISQESSLTENSHKETPIKDAPINSYMHNDEKDENSKEVSIQNPKKEIKEAMKLNLVNGKQHTTPSNTTTVTSNKEDLKKPSLKIQYNNRATNNSSSSVPLETNGESNLGEAKKETLNKLPPDVKVNVEDPEKKKESSIIVEETKEKADKQEDTNVDKPPTYAEEAEKGPELGSKDKHFNDKTKSSPNISQDSEIQNFEKPKITVGGSTKKTSVPKDDDIIAPGQAQSTDAESEITDKDQNMFGGSTFNEEGGEQNIGESQDAIEDPNNLGPDDDDDDDIDDGITQKVNTLPEVGDGLITSPEKGTYVNDKFVNAEDSHFFAYFMTMVIICIIGYLVYHNKQKILALALEGRSRRSTRRRPNTSGYRKLDSNLEEAVTSACSTSVTHVIY